MKGYVADIGQETISNENFRRVLYTAKNSQLVVMHLNPGEDIGAEVHELDQFIRVEAGEG
ncbi:MAG TPA: cupin domain-containing protein, partial [Patescibacteria group bacterium]|nr:cupin domain-containing protein [Patescibacteria group bacterium]